MLGAIFVAAAGLLLFRLLGGAPQLKLRRDVHGEATVTKITELTEYASKLRSNNKYTAAEKVYMEILKLDHRHAPTYSRLGTLYSAQRNATDAIECFTMATQLKPSGSTFYNLGLAYFENRNYIKAIAAFEKSIMFEPSVQRYIGLAKSFKKIDKDSQMIAALEQAVDFEPTPRVLWLLADVYEAAGRSDEAAALQDKVKEVDPKDERLKAMRKRRKRKAAGAASRS